MRMPTRGVLASLPGSLASALGARPTDLPEGVRKAKPLLWDAPLATRARAVARVSLITASCALRGCEWHTVRPTRCVEVTACRNCGKYIGASVDRRDPERECLWFTPSMRARGSVDSVRLDDLPGAPDGPQSASGEVAPG